MRREGDLPEIFEVSPEEREALDLMLRLTNCGSRANVIRTALWNFSDHLDLHLPRGVFDERHGTSKGRPRKEKLETERRSA